MTARLLYEAILIELHKENAPNIILEDFNYYANKAINLYINKRYNIYDINQQTTDDLRVLQASAVLTPTQVTSTYDELTNAGINKMATYEVNLPTDYLHILNCICIYNVEKTHKCYDSGDTFRAAAKRLTADMYSLVLDNFWNKPTYKRPYYYIHNVNSSVTLPTDNTSGTISTDFGDNQAFGNDGNNKPIVTGEGLPKIITIGVTTTNGNETSILQTEVSNVERGQSIRYGNVSSVRLEIRYGTDNSVFALSKVYIDYIKTPLNIRLTQKEIDKTEDTSLMLEYPDYVCQEIINELVHLIMENISDLRLQTHPVVSLSIANPTQQLTSAESTSA